MAAKKVDDAGEVVIQQIDKGLFECFIVGTSPLIMNRMSQKVWFELLAPKGKKNAMEKASSLKHDPIKEFRDSPYRTTDPKAPTVLAVLPTAFKRAMGTAALDTPGAKKAQIGRLVYVEGELLPVYGIPRVFMATTRSSDMNRTPDVRTRSILPEWACNLKIWYTKPILRSQSILNLLAAAGFQCGIGDWRQEKGSGSYGSFRVVNADDADYHRIVSTMGRKPQQEALDHPVAYNDETSEMLAWFEVEIKKRGFTAAGNEAPAAPAPLISPVRRRRGNGAVVQP